MIENLPAYISITFLITTFVTVGFFLLAVRRAAFETAPGKIIAFLIPFWMFFQAVLASGGFYLVTDSVPPRLMLFGVFPAFVLIILYFIFFRENFISRLPLKILILLHVIRIPVELVLLWLFQNKLVPELMTFEGRNFDILSGLTAPLIYWLAFRNGKKNRTLLIVWNLAALALLINIVVHAILSFPFPFQQMAFEQPNRAVLYFPYIWLPTVIVPIVLFSHLISLRQLFSTYRVNS